MKSILFVGCKVKEQLRIKRLLETEYQVEANPSVHHSLSLIESGAYDLIVFDVGNNIPLTYFLDSVGARRKSLRVALLADRIDQAQLQEYRRRQVVSIIKKPCSKSGLLNGIAEGLESSRQESDRPKAVAAGGHRILREQAEVLIGLRQNAVITSIGPLGVGLRLPAAIANGTRIFFSNAEFYRVIGLPVPRQAFVSLVVKHCGEHSMFRYDVRASLDDPSEPHIAEAMQRFVDANAVAPRVATGTVRTVLVADRNVVTRNFFKVALQNRGFLVETAADGAEVLDALDDLPIDLVVTELALPSLSGMSLVQAIRRREHPVPLVVATGETDPRTMRAMEPLVQDYLSKPVSGAQLADRVAKAFEAWNEGATGPTGGSESHVDVSIQTDLRVAFHDSVHLLGITPAGLTFARKQPIAAESEIVLKTRAIALDGAAPSGGETSVQLTVERCSPYGKAGQYLVDTVFSA